MKLIRNYKKTFALTLIFLLITETLAPMRAFAITGFSSMPEYRSFEPVATTNMVNNFDGSFTYNIPIMDIPNGYPLSLSYHSNDVNSEAQASWVGLGWTLNPGAINRVKRGFPDEFNGQNVTYYNKMERNWTVGAGIGAAVEIFGNEGGLNLSLGSSIRYNNYQGVGTTITGGIGLAGMASLKFSYSNDQFGFTPSINPVAILSKGLNALNDKDKSTTNQSTSGKSDPQKKRGYSRYKAGDDVNKLNNKGVNVSQFEMKAGGLSYSGGSSFSISSVPPSSFPTIANFYTGVGVHLNVDVGVNLMPIPIAPEGKINGSFVAQKNSDYQTIPAYGYMFSEMALEPDKVNSMMDYMTENDSPYEKRDNILGIPLPNNDIFNLSGEAMGGSFRPYRSEYGHYRKNYVKSETYSIQAGVDVKLPSIFPIIPPIEIANLAYSLGAEIGGDYQYITVGNWEEPGNANNFKFKDDNNFTSSNEKFFFRFAGDLAGNYDLSGNDEPFRANVRDKNPDFDNWTTIGTAQAPDTRSNKMRSSFVDYSYNEDFDAITPLGSNNNISYKVAEKKMKIHYLDPNVGTISSLDYNRTYYKDQNAKGIGELVTNNGDGVQYVYGLPLYSRNEKELQYGLKNINYSLSDNDNGTDGGGLIATINENIESASKRKLGYESTTPYASSFLLTQINSPDYIDRTYDGPTVDDYGSYTRFNYICSYGGNNNQWYPYRSPYKGVNFDYGSLSVNDDDMGSFSYGEKEIYFIQSIASKTHVAIFTLESRNDALGAKLSSSSSMDDIIKGETLGTLGKQLKRLKRIDLYAIKDVVEITQGYSSYKPKAGALPIKTIHFEYDYSLCKQLPNNINYQNAEQLENSGKLTLKKVWFEYNGKATSKISPYVFYYEYPTNASDIYPSIYRGTNSIASFYNYPVALQNPNYSVLNSDRWGNYRNYAKMKTDPSVDLGNLARFFPFSYQNFPESSNVSQPATEDPAAYCLKRIGLPSGGEIHIQYERNDYQFVQDKRAMMMVPLKKTVTSQDEAVDSKRYYLDMSKVGVDITNMSVDELKTLAKDMFQPMNDEKLRIYFNFLYALLGSNPDFTKKNSDYLEGYSRISGYGIESKNDAGVSANAIYFTFKDNTSSPITSFYQTIDYPPSFSKKELPRKVCLNFYKTQRRAKISGESNALDEAGDSGSGEDLVKAFANLLSSITNTFEDKCTAFMPEMSYVRLQVPLSKKKLGGGVRVKRLMMYDEGVVKTDPNNVLYGQEFNYTTTYNGKTISSGVASNEPSVGRRENPFVNPIEKDEQTKLEAMLYGKDMYSQEGPLGESLMPAPSIGYSMVTIKNIYKGKTSTGSEVHEFYTWKDYPFISKRTTIDAAYAPKMGGSLGLEIYGVGVSAIYSREDPFVSQGYSFISRSINGKPKRIAKFAFGVDDKPMAEEIYEYYQPEDVIKVMDDNMKIQPSSLSEFGKESEILSEIREVADISSGGSIGADVTLGPSFWYIPPFFAFVLPTVALTGIDLGFHLDEKILSTHVTSKIITYPCILKSITNISDGVRNVSVNEVLNKADGNPVIVRSYDDFKGTYLNQDFMASWSYKNMRSKSINERMKSSGTLTSGYIQLLTAVETAKFTEGDFLEVKGSSGYPLLCHVSQVDAVNNRITLVNSKLNTGTITAGNVNIQVVNSGYTNQLNVKMGNLVLHGKDNIRAITPMPNLNSTDNKFIKALNDKLNTINLSGNTSGTFTLAGPYDNMSVSMYIDDLPDDCKKKADRISIRNVLFGYKTNNGILTLDFKEFDIICEGEPVHINTCD